MTDAVQPKPVVNESSFVTLHYRIRLADNQQVIVSTFEDKPATLTIGAGQLAEGLERCLFGMQAGQRDIFTLPAGSGYGDINPDLYRPVSKALLSKYAEEGTTFEPGEFVHFPAPDGGQFAGTARAQYHFRQNLQALQAITMPRPEVFVNHNEEKFDAAGNLTDAETRRYLARWLEAGRHGQMAWMADRTHWRADPAALPQITCAPHPTGDRHAPPPPHTARPLPGPGHPWRRAAATPSLPTGPAPAHNRRRTSPPPTYRQTRAARPWRRGG